MLNWFRKPPPLDIPREDRESISSLVYTELNRMLSHYSGLDVWLSRDYDSSMWPDRLNEEQAKIDKIRTWAKQLPSGIVKDEYLQWLAYFYQSGVDDARNELKTKNQKQHMDNYTKREEFRREALRNHPRIPKPTI